MHEISSKRLRPEPSFAGEDDDALVESEGMPAWAVVT
jgi:hypothetical protein